jgi:hypothetical protein
VCRYFAFFIIFQAALPSTIDSTRPSLFVLTSRRCQSSRSSNSVAGCILTHCSYVLGCIGRKGSMRCVETDSTILNRPTRLTEPGTPVVGFFRPQPKPASEHFQYKRLPNQVCVTQPNSNGPPTHGDRKPGMLSLLHSAASHRQKPCRSTPPLSRLRCRAMH